jgi:hypothetical protein
LKRLESVDTRRFPLAEVDLRRPAGKQQSCGHGNGEKAPDKPALGQEYNQLASALTGKA